jgi:CHAT domain-containing protein/Tfp pilus assembly protein PilF
MSLHFATFHSSRIVTTAFVALGLCLPISGLSRAQTPATPKQAAPHPSAEVQKLLDAGLNALKRQPPQLDEARKQCDAALALAERDNDAPGKMGAWREMADLEQELGHFPAARDFLQKALDLSRALGDRGAEAKTLGRIGNNAYLAGNPIQAQQFWEQAVKIYQALGQQAEVAGYMMNIGIVYDNTGNPKKAIETYKQVLPIFEQLHKPQDQANTLANIAIALDKLSETRKALDYWQRALPLYQETKDASNEANALSGIGGEYGALGDRARAQDYYARALKIYQSIGNRNGEAHVLDNIGGSLREAGELDRALEMLLRSVAISHEINNLRTEAAALGDVAIVYDRMGRFADAIRAYQQAIPLFEALHNRYQLANLYNNLGFTYSQAGQQRQARQFFDQALAAYHEIGDRHGEASSLGGIGGIYSVQKHYLQAISYHERALKIFQQLGDPASQAAVLGNIGTEYEKLHRRDAALKALLPAYALLHKLGDLNAEANTLNTIGALYLDQGEFRTAETYFRRALTPARASGNRPYLANILNNLGDAEERQRRLPEAETDLGGAVDLFEQVRADFNNLTEAQSLYLADNLKYYHDYLDILVRLHKTDKAFEAAQQTKARALLDLLTGDKMDLSASLTPEERAQEAALRRDADRLNLAMVREGVQNEAGAKRRFTALKGQLRETESRLRTLMDALYARHPELSRRRPNPVGDWREIAAAVPADTALLDYIVLSDHRVLLFVVTQQQNRPTLHAFPIEAKQDSFSKLAAALRAVCADPRRSYRSQARQLADLLILPAAADLTGKHRLLICPDGALWDVPFQALLTEVNGLKNGPAGQRREHFLAEAFEIGYAYSAGSIRASLSTRNRPDRLAAHNSILVFADPDFGTSERFGDNPELKGQRPLSDPSRPLTDPSRPLTDPSRPLADPSRPLAAPSRPLTDPSRGIATLLHGGRIPALPGTRREAQALRSDFPDAAIYLGAQAQEDVCKRLASQYRYLHFATHGFFNDAAPMLSSIVLAQPQPGSGEDGFLTAREVADLKLNADLVVLSACNTARGERRGGEGVVGLTWALFVAGAPTQVVSQWSVNDASTALLMQHFYTNLTRNKMSKSAALRSAELSLLSHSAYRHPYYWAPFVLLGDWR